MKIIPAIDIIDGKCVRLTKGDFGTSKIYSDNPVEMAKKFEASGISNLHLVDLDGARSGKIVNYNVLSDIAKSTNLQIDFGGGLLTAEDVQIAFSSGASQITGGSVAVKNRTEFLQWINNYGAEKIILGADITDGRIAVSGWTQVSEIDMLSFVDGYLKSGIATVICTDISKDGMLEGPSIKMYESMLRRFPTLGLIASGGVSSIIDLEELRQIGCHGAIVGKAIYEGRITLSEIEKFIVKC